MLFSSSRFRFLARFLYNNKVVFILQFKLKQLICNKKILYNKIDKIVSIVTIYFSTNLIVHLIIFNFKDKLNKIVKQEITVYIVRFIILVVIRFNMKNLNIFGLTICLYLVCLILIIIIYVKAVNSEKTYKRNITKYIKALQSRRGLLVIIYLICKFIR